MSNKHFTCTIDFEPDETEQASDSKVNSDADESLSLDEWRGLIYNYSKSFYLISMSKHV